MSISQATQSDGVGTVLIIKTDDSMPLHVCCTCLAVNFLVDHSLKLILLYLL